jgi:hypothetical protein
MWTRKFLAGFLFIATCVSTASAQNAAPAAAPAIEPRAMALLDAMSRRLADARTLSFTARVVYDVPTADKTPIFLTTVSHVTFKRPDRLRIATIGDGPDYVFVSDGTKMARVDQVASTLATKAVPQGLDALLRNAGEHGVDLPIADVLLEKPFGDLSKGVTSAFVVGQSHLVGGVQTNIISVSDAVGHMQLWIGADDNLPRQVWVTETRGGQMTRNMVSYTNWTVNRWIGEGRFSSTRYSKLRKVEMKPVSPTD